MKYFLLLFTIILSAIDSFAQVITVVTKDSGSPIEMTSISSDNPSGLIYTNEKGEADISVFKDAKRITIQIVGYATKTYSYQELLDHKLKVVLEGGLLLDPYVIAYSKWNQKSSDIVPKVVSISAENIALQNPQTAADMLATSGYVFIQKSQQGGGSPMIRGFSTNRLLYAVDGIRMNTAIFRGGNLQNVISLDPLAIEHSEVLFGPGSVVYGSDAIGGVMSFQTITPELSHTDKMYVTGKSVFRHASANKEKTGHFDVNLGWKKWASVSSFSYNQYEDLRMGSFGPDDYLKKQYVIRKDSVDLVVNSNDPKLQRFSGYSQFNIMQKLRFKATKKWDFLYSFHLSQTSDYARYDRHLRTKEGLPKYGEWKYGPQKWMMNNLQITHHSESKIMDEMVLRIAHQKFEESRYSRNYNQLDRKIRIENVVAYSMNLDIHKSIKKKHQIYYGTEVVINDVKSNGMQENIGTGIRINGPSRYPNARWMSFAVYLTDQYSISKKLIAEAGIRYNYFILDADFDTTFYPFPFTNAYIENAGFSGSLGLVYKPDPTWVFKINGATGLRSPNVDDMGKVFDSEQGAVVVPNANLKPEIAYNAELSMAKIFSKSVKIDLTGYYTYLQHALVRRDYQLGGKDSIMYFGELSQVQAIQNAAFAKVYGIQVGIEIKLPKGFGLLSHFNYQKGEEELDNGIVSPSRHAAPAFGTTKITYNKKGLLVELYTIYNASVSNAKMPLGELGKPELYTLDANGSSYAPAWYTLNIKAMYKFESKFTFSFGIENILDKRYRPYSSGLVAAGRNVVVGVRVGF